MSETLPKGSKDLIREFEERRIKDSDSASKRLNEAVNDAVNVWERDFDNPVFQRSILAQIPYMVDPDAPTLTGPISVWDIFDARMNFPHRDYYNAQTGQCIDGDVHQGYHALQSAEEAMTNGWSEEVIVAAFLHDFGKLIRRQQHSWFSAEMFKPYISEKLYWLILWHFDIVNVMPLDDERIKSSGFAHPGKSTKAIWYNRQAFVDIGGRVPQRLGLNLEAILAHPWYSDLAKVRQADDFGRVPHRIPQIREELTPMLERQIKLLPGGLGNDGSSAERLWRVVVEGVWMT